MAAKKKADANWGGVLVVVIVLAALLLFGKKAKAAGSSGVGGGSPLQKYPSPLQPQQQQRGTPQAGVGSPQLPGGGKQSLGTAAWFANLLSNMRAYDLPRVSSYYTDTNAAVNYSIPLEGMSLFDVNQLATDVPGNYDLGSLGYTDYTGPDSISAPFDWGGYSPNDFLVTQDVPSSDSSSSSDSGVSDAFLMDQYLVDTSAMFDSLSYGGVGGDPSAY